MEVILYGMGFRKEKDGCKVKEFKRIGYMYRLTLMLLVANLANTK